MLTLVSDIANAPRLAYVGIDNRNAGRLAGHLLGRFVPGSTGEVALFAGSLSYRGHEEREMGFRHILAEDFPHLGVVELREVRDDLERSYPEARPCSRHDRVCAGSTTSAPATGASPGRSRNPGGSANWSSSATS